MPLNLRLKPGERIILNGAVLRNASSRAISVELLNRATTLHERDLMLPEQASTPLATIYFQVQMMHLEPERHDEHFKPFVELAAKLYAHEMQLPEGADLCDAISDVISLVGQRNMPAALRRLQKFVGKPGDARGISAADAKENDEFTEN
jgi:flagellar biosynthesis regulator FlbT